MPASGQMKSIFRAQDGEERRFGIADQTRRRFQTAASSEPLAGMDASRDAMPAVGLNRRAAAVERRQKDDYPEGEENISHTFISDGKGEASVLIRPREVKSGNKFTGQLAPVDLAPLVHRNFRDEENPLWDLPPAQARPAMLEQIGLLHQLSRHHAGRHFFVAQD
jgi:hypothetical protein